MTPDDDHLTRFRSNERQRIILARLLRDRASNLRERVSEGSYNEDDLQVFRELINSASMTLSASNPQLGRRAGLGDGFFSSMSREERKPKLANFLRALTAIIEVADERLLDIEREDQERYAAILEEATNNLTSESSNLLLLSISLSALAQEELRRLADERPNDLESIKKLENQRELLEIFARGFEKIASVLNLHPDVTGAERSHKIVKRTIKAVANEFEKWWSQNSQEVVDWTWRIPVLSSGVAALNMAGANMPIATSAMVALVGGEKAVSTLKKLRAK